MAEAEAEAEVLCHTAPDPPFAAEALCQYDGKGKFVAARIELSAGGELCFKGEDGGAVRTVSVKDCTAGRPKSSRKGHPHALRLNVAESETRAAGKFVLSMGSAAGLADWLARLGKFSVAEGDGEGEGRRRGGRSLKGAVRAVQAASLLQSALAEPPPPPSPEPVAAAPGPDVDSPRLSAVKNIDEASDHEASGDEAALAADSEISDAKLEFETLKRELVTAMKAWGAEDARTASIRTQLQTAGLRMAEADELDSPAAATDSAADWDQAALDASVRQFAGASVEELRPVARRCGWLEKEGKKGIKGVKGAQLMPQNCTCPAGCT